MVQRRITVENPTDRSLSVKLTLPGDYAPQSGNRLSQRVMVEGKGRTQITLPVPLGYRCGGEILVNVGNNRTRHIKSHISNPNPRHDYDFANFTLMVSRGLSAEDLKAHLRQYGNTNSATITWRDYFSNISTERRLAHLLNQETLSKTSILRFEGEGTAWPRHWLGYSAFDGCLLTATDYLAMTGDARLALLDYVAAGGRLAIFDSATLPEEVKAIFPRQTALLSGACYPDRQPASISANILLSDTSKIERYEIGFGCLELYQESNFTSLGETETTRLVQGWLETLNPWASTYQDLNYCLAAIPVKENVRLPIRSFLGLLLLFTLLAGPGAVIYTSRRKRHIQLFFIVPLFSLLFTGAIISYALLAEGITPVMRRQALTLLDQPNQRAVTYGALGIYCPMSLRNGLRFDNGSEITPMSEFIHATIEIGNDQHYRNGWLKPRVPSFFRIRRSERRAERLVVKTNDDGTLEIVNGLGANITHLQLCDATGRIYKTTDVAAGAKHILREGSARSDAMAHPLTTLNMHKVMKIDAGWNIVQIVKEIEADKTDFATSPGTYIALLEDTPFIENPLAGERNKGYARSVVWGRY
jgi:hypothetical protein